MTAWQPYVPSKSAPWNLRRVVHLHRRVVFGATWREVQRDLGEGPQEAVSRVLEGEVRSEGVPERFEHLAGIIGTAAVDSGSAERVKAWWIYRCLFSPHPHQERLTLMWHNHFATSNLKVNDLKLMKRQNETLRQHAFAPFEELLRGMLRDPALLEWLDASSNRKGQPNENLAREQMELFTLGIGHYGESDVKEAARALTGWTVRQGEFRNIDDLRDPGEKTILGQTGNWNGDDLVRLLLEHPATARRLAWRLTEEFCGEGIVDDAAIEELADGLRRRDLDIGWGVETILRSELFFSEENIYSRVCDPVSFLIGPLRSLECWRHPPSTLILAERLRRMGQDLFSPPNVGGWPGGRSWLSTRTVIGRTNYVTALIQGQLASPPEPLDVRELVDRHTDAESLADRIEFLGQILFGGIDREMVESLIADTSDATDTDEMLRRAVTGLLTLPQAHVH